MAEELAWINAQVPDELRRRFKVACAKADTTMSAQLRKLVESWLKRVEK
ncbi:MAG: hypothetical protein EP299_01755 [Acidobacteria bacterium]|nr:MAG: hypothetical protein EP299_01755 [Acidobacteriota bacterium]